MGAGQFLSGEEPARSDLHERTLLPRGQRRDFFTTSNAATFVLHFVPGAYGNLRAATWAHGLWIVAGNYGIIATSPDATIWTLRASRAFDNLHQVAWLDGRLAAIGNRGTILQSSRINSVLEPPQFVPGAGFRFSFRGVLNQPYQIQASSNLMDWIHLLTFTNQSEHGEFTDTNVALFPRRFYRLAEP